MLPPARSRVADGSRVTVELTSLTSDQPRRDDVVRSNTLQTARFDGDDARLEAATVSAFADFELTKPRVASVLGVADEITLEVRLLLRAAD